MFRLPKPLLGRLIMKKDQEIVMSESGKEYSMIAEILWDILKVLH